MKINKKIKGEFGYLPYQKKIVTFRTILLFAMALIIFFTGYFWTNTKANIFSIIAVLVLLPASRSLVSMIMYFRIPAYNEKNMKEIQNSCHDISLLFQLYLTSYQKNFPISCFAVKGNHLIGFTEFDECDTNACEEHIQGILKQNSIKNVTIKVFKDKNKFIDRIKQLENMESHKQDDDIISYILDISL